MHTLSPSALAFRDRAEDSLTAPPPVPVSSHGLPSSLIVLRDRACLTFRPVPDFRGVTRAFARNERERLPPSWKGHAGGGNYLPRAFRKSTRSSSLSAIIHVHFACSLDPRCLRYSVHSKTIFIREDRYCFTPVELSVSYACGAS